MASPVVEQVVENATTTAGTSHTINLPTATAGHLLIIILDKGSTAATVNAHASLTELLDENAGNGLYIAYRLMDGSEPASYTLTTSASTRTASLAYRISGADNPATHAPVIGVTATGTSTTPDPPLVNIGVTNDYLFIAFFGQAGEEADDDTWVNTPPTNYTPNPPRQKSCGTVGTNLGGLIGAAERQLTGSQDNPGTFSVDVSAAWRAQTICVFPGAATTTLSPTGLAHSRALGANKVNPTLNPTGLAHSRALGAHTVSSAPSGTTLSPTGLVHTRALGANTVNPTLNPTGLAHTRAMGADIVDVTLRTTGLVHARALGAQQLNVALKPTGLAHARALGAHVVSTAGVVLFPSSLVHARALGAQHLNVTVKPTGLVHARALGATLVNPTLKATGLVHARALGAQRIILPLGPASLVHARALGAPTLRVTIFMTSLVHSRALGSPSLPFVGAAGSGPKHGYLSQLHH